MKVGAACPRWFAWLAAFCIFMPIDLQGSQRRGDKRVIAYNKITSRRVWIICRMPARQGVKRNIISFNPCSCSPFCAVLVIGGAPYRGPISIGGAPSQGPVVCTHTTHKHRAPQPHPTCRDARSSVRKRRGAAPSPFTNVSKPHLLLGCLLAVHLAMRIKDASQPLRG